MNKCLITKLSGSVNNDNLPQLGKMLVKIGTPTSGVAHLQVKFNKDETVVVKNGYFTDTTGAENKGASLEIKNGSAGNIYFSNNDCVVSIPKYTIASFNDNGVGTHDTIEFDLSELKYSANLDFLYFTSPLITGDIEALKNNIKLTTIFFKSTLVTGDISNLKGLSKIKTLSLSNTLITGDISNLKDMSEINTLYLPSPLITGNIAALAKMISLKTLTLLSPLITGDISVLNNMTKLTSDVRFNGKLTGEISNLPLKFLSFNKVTKLSWSGTRPSNMKIIALERVNLGNNVDKALNDLAQCEVGFVSSDDYWRKKITIYGTRTSASDNAISTLQSKGYTVSVTPEQ